MFKTHLMISSVFIATVCSRVQGERRDTMNKKANYLITIGKDREQEPAKSKINSDEYFWRVFLLSTPKAM